MMRQSNESPIEFCKKRGWDTQIFKMMIFDYVIGNRDRHGANIELLQDNNGEVGLAPLFDHGVSLIFSCYDNVDLVKDVDIMKDINANNYFFTHSLEKNLGFVPKEIVLNRIRDEHRNYIMRGIDKVLPIEYVDKIWEMIIKRWNRFEEIQNSK